MISKEQIAHDLAISYINNRYGITVKGKFYVSQNDGEISGSGDVDTERFPKVDEPIKVKVNTGEKNFLGLNKKKYIDSGYVIDEIFIKMIDDYKKAYTRFLELLN